jgi:hypothetical protein
MFIGHFGVGFGLKQAAPKVSLGTLFLAAQFVDLLWPTLLLLGIEHVEIAPGITTVVPLDFTHYPVSHSLLTVISWGIGFAAVYWLIRKYAIGTWVCGAAVVSHWILDLIVHRPDLPILPWGGPVGGGGLWNALPGTMIVEVLIFFGGVWLYCRRTAARDRTGSVALWCLIGFLVLIHLGNLFGPPPDSVAAIAWVGHAQWLIVVWAYWIDRHRRVVETQAT